MFLMNPLKTARGFVNFIQVALSVVNLCLWGLGSGECTPMFGGTTHSERLVIVTMSSFALYSGALYICTLFDKDLPNHAMEYILNTVALVLYLCSTVVMFNMIGHLGNKGQVTDRTTGITGICAIHSLLYSLDLVALVYQRNKTVGGGLDIEGC